jgi:MYXO-CTERM domain-containing protein
MRRKEDFMYQGLFRWTLAASVVVMHAGAQAASASSSASIANVQFSLVDLDPGDGITAAYSFVTNAGVIAENFIPSGSALYVGGQVSATPDAFSPISQFSGTPGSSAASASIGLNGMSVSAVETVANSNQGALASVTAGQNNGSFAAPVFSRLLLLLTPQTRLTITADYAASANLDCSPAEQAANQCLSDSFAYGQTNGVYVFSTGLPTQFISSGPALVEASGNGSQTLNGASFWVSNPNSDTVIVSLNFNATAIAVLGNVSPIPEASSAAMLVAGLGLLAVGRRRSS